MHRVLPTVAAVTSLLVPLVTAAIAADKRDIMGIGLGMTSAQILKDAKVPCRINKAGGVSCADSADGSEYKVLLSGGATSRALSVKHTFCSSLRSSAVLERIAL